MKPIAGVLFAALMAITSMGQEVAFFEGTWDEASETAARQNKFILVDAYTKWCGWCKVMDREMFTDSLVASFINDHYVPVKIDFEDSVGVLMARKFRITGYPTTLVFNPGGQLVDRFVGYSEDHSRYLEFLEDAIQITAERIFAYDSRQLDMDWPDVYLGNFGLEKKELTWKLVDSIVNAYLEGQDDLFSEINWSVLFKYQPKEYQDFFIENMDEYSALYGTHETEDMLASIIYEKVVDTAAPISPDELLSLCDKLEDPGENKQFYLGLYYETRNDWKAYCNLLEDYIRENGFENDSYINNCCWTLYENAEDKAILEKAAGWMETLTREHPVWMYLDTYAALLYKLGDLEMAEQTALEAIEKGREEKSDRVGETEKLLEEIRTAESGFKK